MDPAYRVEQTAVYIPAGWRQAIALGIKLPERTRGTALFADVSGFTPLTAALTRALGLRGGAEELPRYFGQVLPGQDLTTGAASTAAAGLPVTAWIDGHLCGQAATQLVDGRVVYVIHVYSADQEPICGAPGKTVTFQVGSQTVSTSAPWDNDALHEWALSPYAEERQLQDLYLPLIERR